MALPFTSTRCPVLFVCCIPEFSVASKSIHDCCSTEALGSAHLLPSPLNIKLQKLSRRRLTDLINRNLSNKLLILVRLLLHSIKLKQILLSQHLTTLINLLNKLNPVLSKLSLQIVLNPYNLLICCSPGYPTIADLFLLNS